MHDPYIHRGGDPEPPVTLLSREDGLMKKHCLVTGNLWLISLLLFTEVSMGRQLSAQSELFIRICKNSIPPTKYLSSMFRLLFHFLSLIFWKKKKSLNKYSSPLGSSNFGLDMTQVIFSENSMIFLLEEYFFNGGLKTAGGPWPASKSSIYSSLVDRVGQEGWMRTQWGGNGGEQGGERLPWPERAAVFRWK